MNGKTVTAPNDNNRARAMKELVEFLRGEREEAAMPNGKTGFAGRLTQA